MDELKLMTTGQIAKEMGVEIHRVEYAVRSRGIDPATRGGRMRLFGPEQVARIAEVLEETATHAHAGAA